MMVVSCWLLLQCSLVPDLPTSQICDSVSVMSSVAFIASCWKNTGANNSFVGRIKNGDVIFLCQCQENNRKNVGEMDTYFIYFINKQFSAPSNHYHNFNNIFSFRLKELVFHSLTINSKKTMLFE